MAAMGGVDPSFESLDEDLTCLVLEKLFPPSNILYAFEGVADLANFARVSRRCARVVKERGWAAACRRVAPEVCAALVPIGGKQESPGGAGWMSFARLLAWCPGQIGVPEKTRSGPLDCQAVRRGGFHACEPAKHHVCRYTLSMVEEISSGKILTAEAERSVAKFYMLCCVHEVTHRDQYGSTAEMRCRIAKKVYRGLVGPAQDFQALSEDESGVEKKGRSASDQLGVCPFCPAPLCRFKRKALNMAETVPADFRICSSGHVVGLVEQRVGFFHQIWEVSDDEEDEDAFGRRLFFQVFMSVGELD